MNTSAKFRRLRARRRRWEAYRDGLTGRSAASLELGYQLDWRRGRTERERIRQLWGGR